MERGKSTLLQIPYSFAILQYSNTPILQFAITIFYAAELMHD